MNFLPDGWRRATLDEVLASLEDGRTIHQGWSPQCEKEPSDDDSVWGVLKTTAVQPGDFQQRHNKRLPASLTPRPLLEVREGDVLITSAGPRARCGVAALVRKTRPRLMLSGKMYRFRFDELLVDPRFGEAYLLSDAAARAIDGMKTGISDSGLNLTHARFRKLPFPLPPLDEQRRIVAVLEEQFSRLDAAGESIRQATLRLRGYLSSVIAYQIERPGWPRRALADLAILITDGDHRPPRRVPKGVPHLEAKHVKHGTLVTDNCTYVSEEGFAQTRKRYDPRPGDVIVTCVGTLGEVAIVPEGLVFSAGRNLAAVRPMPELVTSEYLAYALNTPRTQRLLRRGSGSTAQPHLYLKDLRAVAIPVPDLGEQARSVEQLDAQVSIGRDLERGLKAASSKALGIREALVRDGFAGRFASAGTSSSVLSETVTA